MQATPEGRQRAVHCHGRLPRCLVHWINSLAAACDSPGAAPITARREGRLVPVLCLTGGSRCSRKAPRAA